MNNYSVKIITFGFKYGRPECNHFFDVSWIPNPWRYPDKDPVDIIKNTLGTDILINLIVDYISLVSKKDIVILGIGCSAGRDRSPIIADLVVKELEKRGEPVLLAHRDKTRHTKKE